MATPATISLIVLVMQNTAQSILVPYSRKGKDPYDVSTAVMLQECIKIAISFAIVAALQWQPESARQTVREIKRELFTSDLVYLILPATLYVGQNHLQMTAATSLDGPCFAIFSQVKIITTAIFTAVLLKRHLTIRQWGSVFALFVGVALVQASNTAQETKVAGRTLEGLLYLFGASVLSGFAGVYTERILKDSTSSVWANSLQMALCSFVPAFLPIVAQLTGNLHMLRSLLHGFGPLAWCAVAINVWGGFMVALTVKMSSSVAKSFATSVAVIFTFAISVIFMRSSVTVVQCVGASLVVASIYLYNSERKTDRLHQPTTNDEEEEMVEKQKLLGGGDGSEAV